MRAVATRGERAEPHFCSFLQHNTMESLLERGEKIDDLVSKSEVLGIHSKAFYKTVGTWRSQAPCREQDQDTLVASVL